MSFDSILLLLFFIPSCFLNIQINFHLTDWSNSIDQFYHDCLQIELSFQRKPLYEIISYCLSESSSQWFTEENHSDKKLTFLELSQQHITSQQLYLWSSSIDIAENYQIYLNQMLTTNDILLSRQIFYNCTLPRFGSYCQYSFDFYDSRYSSLNDLVYNFYYDNEYKPDTLTCYVHLECNRGSLSACLDWTEICDGIVDCIDGNDEEYCWPIEILKCKENEFQCYNRQCIPRSFFHENDGLFDCLDGSDEGVAPHFDLPVNDKYLEPTFFYEDIICRSRFGLYVTVLTRSCSPGRQHLLLTAMYSEKSQSINDICWSAFQCIVNTPDSVDFECSTLCSDGKCEEIVEKNCPDMLFIPTGPILFGHIYFLYTKIDAKYIPNRAHPPQYICYNNQFCDGLITNSTIFSFQNTTCRRPEDFSIDFYNLSPWIFEVGMAMYIDRVFLELYKCNTIQYNDKLICNHADMYRCINSSKCISKDRICNKIIDCNYEDDEQCYSTDKNCLIYPMTNLFYCSLNQQCISSIFINDGVCDCLQNDEDDTCDDEYISASLIAKRITFSLICDGFTDILPIMINEQAYTDETECHYWSCNNTYTRCNQYWNCFNGADEIDCDLKRPSINCSVHHHICVSPETNSFMCLPIEKANDHNIDCLGGTDEPRLCRTNTYIQKSENFYCKSNISGICAHSSYLCNNQRQQCMFGEDFQFCQIQLDSLFTSMCWPNYDFVRTDVETYFCDLPDDNRREIPLHFSIDFKQTLNTRKTVSLDVLTFDKAHRDDLHCHRGLDMRVWLNIEKNITSRTCLCPPSYYGDTCQYQNERISFTVRFQVFFDSLRIPFLIIISLIDDSDQRLIHSYQQINYLSIRDCDTKFNIYLLYAHRPKDRTRNYSIHIDIYEKMTLTYRRSLFVAVDFPFLPVQRISTLLYIPRTYDIEEQCTDHRCIHGQCRRYFNHLDNSSFCQCYHGWSGRFCTMKYTCSCSSDSLCLGISANNRSICVCPIDKFGPQCLLTTSICQSNSNTTCYNNGQCIPFNEDIISMKKFKCICPRGFTGERCELTDTKILISFDQTMSLPQAMIIHFIRAMNNAPAENGTTFKIIPIIPNNITIYWTHPFHVAFIELTTSNYYLLIVQKLFQPTQTIKKSVSATDRCKHVNEIFNQTILQLHFIRRMKYYQIPCQDFSFELSCFYDEKYFCFCYQFGFERLSNCLEYNLTKKPDCFGRNHCENGGKCLQDNVQCPQTSICLCSACSYGRLCQFRSNGFGHSLDALLGYHILPHIQIWRQPIIVKISGILTIIMGTVGFVNSLIGIITFREKDLRTTGCAFYLLGSSIASLFTTIIFFLKFWILVTSQMAPITNRSFLRFQCLFVDIILRITLSIDQWLNTCVAVEQAISTIQEDRFNKKKSKIIAKYMIIIVLLLTIGTAIHEPFHQRLIDDGDEDEKRIWCIVTYSNQMILYDSIINMFHFFVPFLINCMAVILILMKLTRQYRIQRTTQAYNRRQLREQFQQQKEVLLSPLFLVFLASPSMIIYLVTNCVESPNESKTFLFGYFMSFSPSIFTFFLFILPSKLYKKKFLKIFHQYRIAIQTRLHRIRYGI